MAKQTFTTGQVLTAAQMTSLQQTAMGGGSPVAKTASYVLVAADAGTVIQMNSASATTITVNTALFAAGDSVQIQNIGTGICTITAGTATVTTAGSLALSQWEGGSLYFTSTSAAIFFDVVQSASAGGGITLLSTTTLSGASTTISSIDQTYTNLVAVIYGMTNATSDGGILVRPNNLTTSTSHVITNTTAAGTASSVNSQNGDMLLTYSSLVSRTDANNAYVLTINNYANTTFPKAFNFYGQQLAAPTAFKYSIQSSGNIITTSAITSLVFIQNGGNWSTGTVLLYGVK
jgi:hypothetical protein